MPPRQPQFTRDSLGLAFTQYLVRAMSMARGFVAAKLLDPMAFGAWNALQLMMDYGALAPLGTQQGLDQMVPARLVEGDPRRVKRLKQAAEWIGTYRQFWEASYARLDDYLNALQPKEKTRDVKSPRHRRRAR